MKKKLIKNLLLVLTLVVMCFAVGVTASAETWGDYEYVVLENGTIEISKYNGTDTVVDIPIEIDGKTVTVIGNAAFKECININSINIPDSVTSIDLEAFYWCVNLKSIIVDEDNKYYSNDEFGVLFNKDKTVLVAYPMGCAQTFYTIPDGVTTIAEYAFYDCFFLKGIIIPDTVTDIKNGAFSGCLSLKSIRLPKNISNIGYAAFTTMPSLEDITIEGMNVDIDEYELCASYMRIVGISCEDFVDLFYKALTTGDNNLLNEWFNYIVYAEEEYFMLGTIYCHAGSTAEAYAIANGIDYVLTHFFEDEWTYDYDNLIRYRKCIHCDELETEAIEPEVPAEPEPDTPATPEEETKDNFFTNIFDFIKTIIDLLFGWINR